MSTDDFFRDFNKAEKRLAVGFGLFALVNLLVSIAVLGFIGWVIVQLLQHFGVV